ncbi:MAG: alpha/beta fold hydrolase [Lachnospiraceae bacterium]|nr:alpha/beta fold hydrolase [Lachnospiraceae bacterium]
MTQHREFFIDHDGIKLHAKLDIPSPQPENCPVVVIQHGFTGNMEEDHIRGQAEMYVSRGCAALRTELYGHGKSDGEFRDHTVLKWMDELMTVIDYADSLGFPGGVYLTGHSQGGLTAILTAAMKRDVIRGLIPLAPAISIKTDAEKGIIFGSVYDPLHIPAEVACKNGLTLGGNYMRAAQMLPVEEAVKAYTGPVLLIHADTDETVPVECSGWAAENFKNAQLIIIEGDNHGFRAHTREVLEAAADFIDSIRASS